MAVAIILISLNASFNVSCPVIYDRGNGDGWGVGGVYRLTLRACMTTSWASSSPSKILRRVSSSALLRASTFIFSSCRDREEQNGWGYKLCTYLEREILNMQITRKENLNDRMIYLRGIQSPTLWASPQTKHRKSYPTYLFRSNVHVMFLWAAPPPTRPASLWSTPSRNINIPPGMVNYCI